MTAKYSPSTSFQIYKYIICILKVFFIQTVLPTTVGIADRWVNSFYKFVDRYITQITFSRPVKIVLSDRPMGMHELACDILLFLVHLSGKHKPSVAIKQNCSIVIRSDGSTHLISCWHT